MHWPILAQKGVVETAVGRGTFVAPPPTPLFEDVWSREEQSEPYRPFVLREDLNAPEGPLRLLALRLPDLGQSEAIRVAMVRAAKLPAEQLMNYPTRQTLRGLQAAALDWFADRDLGPLSAEDIVPTYGGQNAIGLILQTILAPSTRAIVSWRPSWPGMSRRFPKAPARPCGSALGSRQRGGAGNCAG
ncbi:MAG: hypothetical protein P8X69_15140 [Maritimibacter sp.]